MQSSKMIDMNIVGNTGVIPTMAFSAEKGAKTPRKSGDHVRPGDCLFCALYDAWLKAALYTGN